MSNVFIILTVVATVINSIVEFAKPAYKKFAGRFNATINIALSFILWIIAAFSIAPLVNLELNTGTLLLLWLALWTGANIFHDAWNLLKAATSRIRKDLE